jgi:hypothetical protein
MLHSRRFDDDLAKEVTQHPFGSPSDAVHRHDAKMFRADGLNPLLDLTGRFADKAFFRSCRFPFSGLCDHP